MAITSPGMGRVIIPTKGGYKEYDLRIIAISTSHQTYLAQTICTIECRSIPIALRTELWEVHHYKTNPDIFLEVYPSMIITDIWPESIDDNPRNETIILRGTIRDIDQMNYSRSGGLFSEYYKSSNYPSYDKPLPVKPIVKELYEGVAAVKKDRFAKIDLE